MTSPQRFEAVANPFTALQLVDFTQDGRGLLYLHDGSQSLLRRENNAELVLTLYDPWDEAYFAADLEARLRVIPHGPMDHAERWRLAQAFTRPALTVRAAGEGGDLPAAFSPLQAEGAGVLVTALYRETEDRGFGVQHYAGANLGHPYVFRLVEFNGRSVPVQLDLAGTVAAAYKTNLLGEMEAELVVERRAVSSRLQLTLRPYEIATLYLDLVEGRKTNRDLDARRGVWAQVHRTGESR